MNELIRIVCPECGAEMEVQPDWDGRKVKCPYCEEKFILQMAAEQEDSDDPRTWTVAELRQNIRKFFPKITSSSSRNVLAEVDKIIVPLEREAKRRFEIENKKAEEECVRRIPSCLRFTKSIFLKHRNYSDAESEILGVLNDALGCRSNIARYIHEIDRRSAEESKRKSQAEAKRKAESEINERIQTIKDQAIAFVREVRRHGAPPVVSLPHFEYQKGEMVYLCLQHAKWSVTPTSDWDNCEEGSVIITNQRFIFTATRHRQVYRIKNIRDFDPCWEVSRGQIQVASSERRCEYYLVPNAWLVSAVVSVMWNESFRAELMDGTEEESVACIWDRIERSAKLFALGLGNVGINCQQSDVTPTINSRGQKEYHVGGKTYIDMRGLSFAEGMAVSFQAGTEGKEVFTDWDWQSGRAQAILRGERR